MTDDYFVIRIPRMTGRKTLAVNGLAIVLAAGMGAYAGLGNDAWLSGDAIAVLGIMAIVNLALRVVTDRPVSWREPAVDIEGFLAPIETAAHEARFAGQQQKAAQQAAMYGAGMVHEWVHDELWPFVSDPAPVTSLEDYAQIKRIKEHAVRNEMNAENIAKHLAELEQEAREANELGREHLKAHELPDDAIVEYGDDMHEQSLINGHARKDH